MTDRVNFTTGQYDNDDYRFHVILTDDYTDGFVIGDMEDVKNLHAALTRLIERGHADEEIYEFDERLGTPWLTVSEAAGRWGISERTVSYAASHGHIKNAEMLGGRYRFSQNAFLAWKNNRPKPGPKPQEDESPHDFSHSGLGIGGLGRHVEEPVIPSVERMRELEAEKARYVKCDCGHSVPPAQVMRASLGTSCPDCYDRMSDSY